MRTLLHNTVGEKKSIAAGSVGLWLTCKIDNLEVAGSRLGGFYVYNFSFKNVNFVVTISTEFIKKTSVEGVWEKEFRVRGEGKMILYLCEEKTVELFSSF